MVFSRKYSRNFISLNQESSAYNLDFRACMGKCIIEIRENVGKINISVQGLKPSILYKICLISLKDTELKEEPLGFIDIDVNGKGESKISFNPDNINNSGLKIEDCNVISIIVEDNELTSPLVGYIGEEIYWREKYISYKENASKFEDEDNDKINEDMIELENEINEDITEFDDKINEDINEFDNEINEDIKLENLILDNKVGEIEDTSEKNTQNNSNINKNDIENTNRFEDFNNLIKNFKKEMLNLEENTSNKDIISNIGQNINENNTNIPEKNMDIEYIKIKNPIMKPFENNKDNTVWYRISPEELVLLGEDIWKYSNNQFVFVNYKKYKHLILGIKLENMEDKYILGVPCKFEKNFSSKGLNEFNNFVPLNNNINENSLNNSYGYRLLNINCS